MPMSVFLCGHAVHHSVQSYTDGLDAVFNCSYMCLPAFLLEYNGFVNELIRVKE